MHWLTELQNELLSKLAPVVGEDVVDKLAQHSIFFKSGRKSRSAAARALGLKPVQFHRVWQTMREALAGEE
jgi:hypothetical protein